MTLSYRIRALERSRRQRPSIDRRPVTDLLAPCYMELHNDVVTGQHSTYNLPGGRGSCKSSFVSLEIVEGIMNDPDANGIVFRRTGATMRESVYEQIQWAIDELGVGNAWKGNVNPMRFTYLPTGQQIVFRGMDDSSKLKSIKLRKGYFKYIWFEEFAEFQGPNTIRSVLQSVQRGGSDYRIFNTFNPPLSMNSWANKYILIPKKNAITFRTDYRMIPPEWLGEAFIEEAERLKEVNENAYRHEYLGEAIGTGGTVFPNVIQRAITEEEATNADYIYHGIDWGFSVDPCVVLKVGYCRKTDTIIVLDEIYKHRLTNQQLAEEIKARGFDQGSYLSPTFYADSAEPKSIADLVQHGISVRGAQKWPGSVLYGIKWLQSRRIVIDPERTPHTCEEFVSYEYESTKDGEFLADVPDKDNHCIDAMRYAISPLLRGNNRVLS